jgi:hypothetical protein
MSALGEVKNALASLLGLIQKWGTESMAARAVSQLKLIDNVTRNAYRQLGRAVKPVSDAMLQLARRLDIDADMAHRAHLDSINEHAFHKLKNETEEIAAFEKGMPSWVDKTKNMAYKGLQEPPKSRPGWPRTASFDTFHTMQPKTLPPGAVLYRIVDPTSKDNSICWMSKEEFDQRKSKDAWRRRFAVWARWNSNGEFVVQGDDGVGSSGIAAGWRIVE